jgi:hypothetical protein
LSRNQKSGDRHEAAAFGTRCGVCGETRKRAYLIGCEETGQRDRPLNFHVEVLIMKKLLIFTVALAFAVPMAAFGRGGGLGGMGSHRSSITGGAFGSSPAAPGTNSLGTALSSSGAGDPMKGPELGTGNPAVDREDARVAKQVESICRGC